MISYRPFDMYDIIFKKFQFTLVNVRFTRKFRDFYNSLFPRAVQSVDRIK